MNTKEITSHFYIIHPQGKFEISALVFQREEELGVISADFLVFFGDSGLQLSYVRYENKGYSFERSSIGNVFWNDSFKISNGHLRKLIDMDSSIVVILESAYQYWLKHDECRDVTDAIRLNIIRDGIEIHAELAE